MRNERRVSKEDFVLQSKLLSKVIKYLSSRAIHPNDLRTWRCGSFTRNKLMKKKMIIIGCVRGQTVGGN